MLEQTKGKFKLEGKVVGISNTENAYHEGYTNSDKPYKSLSFFVQTSPDNKVKVELFGMERDEVTAYSQKAKESKKVKWANRHNDHKDFKVMGVNMFLEKGSDGKNKKTVLVEFDAIDYILKNLNEDDSVRVSGDLGFQNYENQQGEMKESVKFNIRSVSKLDKAIDFTEEDFKEVSMFEQEIVATETIVDTEAKKLIIGSRTITYQGKETPTATFVVDAEKLPKLANNMAKRLSFGDFIKVFGLVINKTVKEEAEVEADESLELDDWGGDDDIKSSMETQYITNYINELQVTTVDSSTYKKGKYKEEDFFSKDEDAFNGNLNDGDEFEDGEDEGEVDDLPFS